MKSGTSSTSTIEQELKPKKKGLTEAFSGIEKLILTMPPLPDEERLNVSKKILTKQDSPFKFEEMVLLELASRSLLDDGKAIPESKIEEKLRTNERFLTTLALRACEQFNNKLLPKEDQLIAIFALKSLLRIFKNFNSKLEAPTAGERQKESYAEPHQHQAVDFNLSHEPESKPKTTPHTITKNSQPPSAIFSKPGTPSFTAITRSNSGSSTQSSSSSNEAYPSVRPKSPS